MEATKDFLIEHGIKNTPQIAQFLVFFSRKNENKLFPQGQIEKYKYKDNETIVIYKPLLLAKSLAIAVKYTASFNKSKKAKKKKSKAKQQQGPEVIVFDEFMRFKKKKLKIEQLQEL